MPWRIHTKPLGQQMSANTGYDAMQACLNGHLITSSAIRFPQHRQDFCSKCGMRTTMACEACETPIRGRYHSGAMSVREIPVPKYCHGCGQAYPWQQAAIENLKDLLEVGEVAQKDLEMVVLALPDIIHETPRSEGAALKVARILKTVQKPAYDLVIKVLSDLASETAKKAMGF